MNKQLIFPVFAFQKNDNMIYVFFNEKNLKSTSTRFLKKNGFINDVIIDSQGYIYIIKKAFMIKYRGLLGYSLLLKGRQILVDFEFDKEVSSISLEEFKFDLINRINKTKHIWQSSYEIKELILKVNESNSFEDLAYLLK